MSEIFSMEERENLEKDCQNLRQYQKEIKETARKRYDELHIEFLDTYFKDKKASVKEMLLIKAVFDFLKQNV